MSRIRGAIGAAVVLAGMLIAAGPFISVWRVGPEMLGELPDLEGIDQRDDPVGWTALFDDEFVVARRTYDGADERTVGEGLVAGGFEPLGVVGFSKECCGDYDAVLADVQGSGGDRVVVELRAADSDWQLSWPVFTGFGTLLAAAGFGILVNGRSGPVRPDPTSAAAESRTPGDEPGCRVA